VLCAEGWVTDLVDRLNTASQHLGNSILQWLDPDAGGDSAAFFELQCVPTDNSKRAEDDDDLAAAAADGDADGTGASFDPVETSWKVHDADSAEDKEQNKESVEAGTSKTLLSCLPCINSSAVLPDDVELVASKVCFAAALHLHPSPPTRPQLPATIQQTTLNTLHPDNLPSLARTRYTPRLVS
jgi:hypothetical protein